MKYCKIKRRYKMKDQTLHMKSIKLIVFSSGDFITLDNSHVTIELSVFSLLKLNEMRKVTQKYFSVSDLDDTPTWEDIKLNGDNLRVENCQMVVYKDVFNYTCNIKNSGIKLYTKDICFKDI
jgi:hypothetical protein